jgi:hypothetical protein
VRVPEDRAGGRTETRALLQTAIKYSVTGLYRRYSLYSEPSPAINGSVNYPEWISLNGSEVCPQPSSTPGAAECVTQ